MAVPADFMSFPAPFTVLHAVSATMVVKATTSPNVFITIASVLEEKGQRAR
jgi:hypothetical protein